MTDLIALALRLLHILFGIAWIGAVTFNVGVLRRAMPRIDMDARKKTMRQLIPIATQYVPGAAVMTIVFGALLYLHLGSFDGEILLGTIWGRTILGGLVLSLTAFGLGMVLVVGTGKQILTHLDEAACTHGPEVGALQKRLNLGQIVVLVLGLIIVAIMVEAAHRYLA